MEHKLTSVTHILLEIYRYLRISLSYVIIEYGRTYGKLRISPVFDCQIKHFFKKYSCQRYEHLTTNKSKSHCFVCPWNPSQASNICPHLSPMLFLIHFTGNHEP